MSEPYPTLKEFWPFYLSQHLHPLNRTVHFIGSSGVLVLLAWSFWSQNFYWLLGMPLCGYGFAWIGHFFIEKNRPATFTYPLKSFLSDWRMYYYIFTRQIPQELAKISDRTSEFSKSS
ncbi:MAG: DUF962 domain-containing protein [Planctomycetota bacterium]